MRFFHLSDLHIGLRLYNRDLLEDQRHILDEIIGMALKEQPDAVVIAGDIYDRAVPSAEAVELFGSFVEKLSGAVPEAEIMMISGNHDSAPRLNLFRGILLREHIHMIGVPPQLPGESIEKVTLKDAYGPVNFYLLPFVRPSMVKAITGTDENGNNLSYQDALKSLIEREEINREERNVFVSHQFYVPAGDDAGSVPRMDSEIRTVGNIDQVDASLLLPFDYCALGHIHKPMTCHEARIRYCGTPLACSVSEAGQQKSVLLVELGEKGSLSVTPLPLTPLHDVRVLKGSLEDILNEPSEDYVTVILTGTPGMTDWDIQERLRNAFPNLLEIRREGMAGIVQEAEALEDVSKDPYELCCSFLKEPDEATREVLRQIINNCL